MSRDQASGRPAHVQLPSSSASGAHAAPAPLISLLVRANGPAELIPQLHQHVVDATGGRCSLLFEYNPRNGALQATSAFGLDRLDTEPLVCSRAESTLVDTGFARHTVVHVPEARRQTPAIASRLGGDMLLLLPIGTASRRLGLLVVVVDRAPRPETEAAVIEAADTFAAALELFRFRQNEELRRDLRTVLDEFGQALAASFNLAAALEVFCHGANQLFGADRASVWIHDRRARSLVLKASSDPSHTAQDLRVSSEDVDAPAAVAMRRGRPEILLPADRDAATVSVTVPLRGCRRALGAVVFEGVRVEAGGELSLLDRADQLGGELSASIENVQLIDEAMRSRRELENTFDSITDLVAVADRRGRIVHVNQAFAARVGPAAGLVDRSLGDCVGPDLARWLAVRQGDDRDDTPREPVTTEVDDPVLEGRFVVTLTDLVTSSRERAGTVMVARDLTAQARLEAEREELRRRLAQSEKLAALGQFVAGIAHELNNPLQGVLGHLELLRATGAFPKQLRKEMQTIYREGDRAAKIVRNLLVFAGSRRLTKRRVSVNAIVQKVIALRATACRAAEIEVVRHYDDKLPRVNSDPLLLHQAVLNVVMNAEHAVATAAPPRRIEIVTRLSPAGDRVVLTVHDSGNGIPADVLTRMFEPFYTTKEVGKGTGLGLAIAYGIVQEHGGHISAANHPGGGAVFTIELPVGSPASGLQS